MAKTAKLVVTTFISRVIVDENTTDEQIADLAKEKIQEKLNNDEVLDNIEAILPDDECPYDTPSDANESTFKKLNYPDHEFRFLNNGFHHIGNGLFRKYYNGSLCLELQEINIRDMKYPQLVKDDVFEFITTRTDYRDDVKDLISDCLCPRDAYTSENYTLVLYFSCNVGGCWVDQFYAVHDYIDFDVKKRDDQTCPMCGSDAITADLDFPDTMRNCNQCGAEFTTCGDITFNPKEL